MWSIKSSSLNFWIPTCTGGYVNISFVRRFYISYSGTDKWCVMASIINGNGSESVILAYNFETEQLAIEKLNELINSFTTPVERKVLME